MNQRECTVADSLLWMQRARVRALGMLGLTPEAADELRCLQGEIDPVVAGRRAHVLGMDEAWSRIVAVDSWSSVEGWLNEIVAAYQDHDPAFGQRSHLGSPARPWNDHFRTHFMAALVAWASRVRRGEDQFVSDMRRLRSLSEEIHDHLLGCHALAVKLSKTAVLLEERDAIAQRQGVSLQVGSHLFALPYMARVKSALLRLRESAPDAEAAGTTERDHGASSDAIAELANALFGMHALSTSVTRSIQHELAGIGQGLDVNNVSAEVRRFLDLLAGMLGCLTQETHPVIWLTGRHVALAELLEIANGSVDLFANVATTGASTAKEARVAPRVRKALSDAKARLDR